MSEEEGTLGRLFSGSLSLGSRGVGEHLLTVDFILHPLAIDATIVGRAV